MGGALLIIKYWDEIKAFFSGFWEGFSVETDGIKDAFARVKDEIMRVVDALGLFKDEAKSAEDASEDAGNSVGRFFGQALAVVLDALAGLLKGHYRFGTWVVGSAEIHRCAGSVGVDMGCLAGHQKRH